ncbi:deleted in malignant brain tumors 1 protein-like [Chanos chanos]|uniref:Deleted in malignant brain tumors 1 protein-like n=1 Tax=Chanos chanos TaxID=29144 RepID=A0A6J2WIM2_CHACN|nr:deleted in malignant brain tumors 1 protein-like [Chanos chanos]
MRDAAVVCRELDCGEAAEAPTDSHFGPKKTAFIWPLALNCNGSETTLFSCENDNDKYDQYFCDYLREAGVICSGHKKSRLANGPNLCSGRVEVLHGKTWGTVCDADFDQQDAEVVCRELGCGVPVEVLGAAAFGKGEGPVWSEEIQCRGNESEIIFCPTSSSRRQNCSHDNDVGIRCTGYTDFRLVNGSDSCSGRVELQYLGEWGTVCDASWDMRASSVLCQQLNCGSAVAVVGVDWFGEGSDPIQADVFDCQGNETHLSACVISSWSRAACSHRQDPGVICSGSSMSFHDGRVRLTGERECEGEVEVYFHQAWRRVLLDSWSFSEASVVCRQLDCGSLVEFSGSSGSGPVDSDECLTGFQCSGNEVHLGNCSSPQTTNCSSSLPLSLNCSGKHNSGHRSLRLVGSGSDCAGRLEVFHKGSWGTVCDDSWDIEDDQVVCRQLQCGEALIGPVPAWFGPGTGPIWLDEVDCLGNESSLWSCPSERWGRHDCGHKEDVGVLCSGYKEIRLTEGCSGNLEVFYNGTWGNVCYNQMDSDTVALICQELNCGKSGTLNPAGPRMTSAPNWLDLLKCRKEDIRLWNCPSSPWNQNQCFGEEVATITCSDHLPFRLMGGEGQCSGRLEVYHNGTWGSVCDDLWDIKDAQVVCRQLGCGPALRVDGNSTFGRGEDTVWLSRVECRGTEIHLWDCSLSLKNHTDCSHKSHAWITCTESLKEDQIESYDDVETPSNPKKGTLTVNSSENYDDATAAGKTTGSLIGNFSGRLVGSGSDCAGRLEVLHKGSWGTVCDDSWDIEDAQVVCRELRCGEALIGPVPAWFGPGTGPIWLDEVDCLGNESSIQSCPSDGWGRHDCGHKEDVGVLCTGFEEIRLTEGCSGNLEVFYNGTWGNVCYNQMDSHTVALICQELNCGKSGTLNPAGPRMTSAPNWLDLLKCRKEDIRLWNCPSSPWNQNQCFGEEVATITCSDHLPFRLMEGEGQCSGRLEVYYNGTWGSVCDDLWDIKDAQVVCRQLGCGPALRVDGNAAFGLGEDTVWLSRVECRGTEIHLWDCSLSLKNHTDCSHKGHAWVTCTGVSLYVQGDPLEGHYHGRVEK